MRTYNVNLCLCLNPTSPYTTLSPYGAQLGRHGITCVFGAVVEQHFVRFFGAVYILANIEVATSQLPASSSNSSRFFFWICQILQVNGRQMCGDSTTLIRPNQCHAVTSGQLEASLVSRCSLRSAKEQLGLSHTSFDAVNSFSLGL